MKGKRIVVGAAILCLAVALTLGPGLAQEQEERTQPQGTLSIDAIVNNRFTYQGMLREDGAPVTGRRDMVFRLFSDAGCSTPAVTAHPAPDVEVNSGLFSVELPVPPMALNGQGLWLRIQVEGTTVACQEILPVPYAFSVRPGASIVGDQTGWEAIHAENTATTSWSYGIYAQSSSPAGAGVLAKGVESGADLILAGNSSSQDNGTIYSDPAYPSSDIVLVTNDTIRIDLNHDGDADDGDLEIYDHNNNLLFDVDDSGDVIFGGPGRATFPRPAYDSGWHAISQNSCLDLTHNLGGDRDNYVVDVLFNEGGSIHHAGYGGIRTYVAQWRDEGGWWRDLTETKITVCRNYADYKLDSFRVRIWVYR